MRKFIHLIEFDAPSLLPVAGGLSILIYYINKNVKSLIQLTIQMGQKYPRESS